METDSERACNNRLILKEIFGKLPLPVLQEFTRVSRLWYTVTNEEKLRRQRILWTMKVDETPAQVPMQYYDPSVKLERPVVDIGEHLREILPRAQSEPQLVVMLICNGINRKLKNAFRCSFKIQWKEIFRVRYDSSEDSDDSKDKESMAGPSLPSLEDSDDSKDNESMAGPPLPSLEEGEPSDRRATDELAVNVLERYLPQDCKIVSAFVDGFVGTKDLDLPREILRGAGFTAVCFPRITGVEMFDFTCVDTRSFLTPGMPNVNDRETRIIGLPTNKEIKCLLLFVEFETFSYSILESIQEEYQINQKSLIALGGVAYLSGVMSSQYYYNDEAVQYSCPEIATGVAFTGRNVHAATVVIEKTPEGQDQVLHRLLALKAHDFPEENCIAFLFANVLRCTTKDRVPQRTAEIKAFHEVFPNVPLFGAFGDWIFWIEHLPNVQSGNDLNSVLCIDSDRSRELSVFVLLSFGER